MNKKFVQKMETKYSFDGKFEGNILIVGRTGCWKTTFIQNLGKNRTFGNDIIEVFWVSKIFLNKDREDAIRDSFQIKKFILVIIKISMILIILLKILWK